MRHANDVVVYAFTTLSEDGTRYIASPAKAPMELIARLQGVAFEETAELVSRDELDAQGYYHPPDDAWQSSSFDLQHGLDVQEVDGEQPSPPASPPRPRRR